MNERETKQNKTKESVVCLSKQFHISTGANCTFLLYYFRRSRAADCVRLGFYINTSIV